MIIFNKNNIKLSLILFFLITSAIIFYIYRQIERSDIINRIESNKKELGEKIQSYEKINTEISNYETQINALTPGSVDEDFLEEKAREKLLYSKENEIVIFKEKEK